MARKNSLISVSHNAETNVLSFAVGNAGTIELNVNNLSDDIRTRALLHGLVQKVSDAAAIGKDELAGKSADEIAALKFDAMKSVADRLTGDDADWSKRSGDGTGPVAGIILRAFSQYVADMAAKRKKPVPSDDAIKSRYSAMSKSEQFALRNVPEIAAIMETLRSEKSSKSSVDTKSLLGELGI
jgi:hypothetical protein